MSDNPIVRPYRGRTEKWATALHVALHVASQCGVRMVIRYTPDRYAPQMPWLVTEADVTEAVTR